MNASELDWTQELIEQIDWHWHNQLRPRLEGLSDEEYFWEPAKDCWNVRPRGTSTAPLSVGDGEMTIDYAIPQPDPAPFTTIAWRLGHILVGVLAMRNSGHFGRDKVDYDSFTYAPTAAEALAQLDAEYDIWLRGVKSLDIDGLAKPCGDSEGEFAPEPMVKLVLHIHRELIHHGAEISLLRDLYANQ